MALLGDTNSASGSLRANPAAKKGVRLAFDVDTKDAVMGSVADKATDAANDIFEKVHSGSCSETQIPQLASHLQAQTCT